MMKHEGSDESDEEAKDKGQAGVKDEKMETTQAAAVPVPAATVPIVVPTEAKPETKKVEPPAMS